MFDGPATPENDRVPASENYQRLLTLSSAEKARLMAALQPRGGSGGGAGPGAVGGPGGSGEGASSAPMIAEVRVRRLDGDGAGGHGRARGGDGPEGYVVDLVSLSAQGFRFLHGAFAAAQSRWALLAEDASGVEHELPGVLFECTHLGGRFHLVSVRLDRRIDPQQFLPGLHAGDDPRKPREQEVPGTVLFVDDQELDRDLMASCLRKSRLRVHLAATMEEALKLLEREPVDLILTDLYLGPVSAEDFIRAARDLGYRGNVTLLTSETTPARLAKARAAGAAEIIRKPYTPEKLRESIQAVLKRAPITMSDDPIVCSLRAGDELAGMAEGYIEKARAKAAEIEAARQKNDFDAVLAACATLKATGASYGFEPLTLAADQVVTALRSSSSVEESAFDIRRLLQVVGRLRARGKAEAPGSVKPAA